MNKTSATTRTFNLTIRNPMGWHDRYQYALIQDHPKRRLPENAPSTLPPTTTVFYRWPGGDVSAEVFRQGRAAFVTIESQEGSMTIPLGSGSDARCIELAELFIEAVFEQW